MNTQDKVANETKMLVDSMKDRVQKNLVELVKKGEVELNADQLSRILSLIDMSINDGYQRAIGNFTNSIKRHLG